MCGSGIIVGSVLCNGDIYGCLDIERRPELIQGNIFEDDFVDVWENKFKEYRIDRTAACSECALCKEQEYCKGDSMHTWDFDNHRPKICYNKLIKREE
jgi:radical SAM protein with 4Fe4S-binding SPASM domain